MYRARIDLRVRNDERDQWEAWAAELGVGMSEMIRRAVPAYYAAEKSKQDRPRRRVRTLPAPESYRQQYAKAVAR